MSFPFYANEMHTLILQIKTTIVVKTSIKDNDNSKSYHEYL